MNLVTLPDGRQLSLPDLQFSVMGYPGSGKSHLIASMPKPLLVIALDPMAKMLPYFERGMLDPKVYTGPTGLPVRLVKSKKTGDVIIQVEGYYDYDIKTPNAMQTLISRCETLPAEVNAGTWRSVAVDSWSSFEEIARNRRGFGPFAISNNDGRAIYAAAKDDVKALLLTKFVHLNSNLGLSFHITEKLIEESGTLMYNMKCIGDLASTVGGNIAERYRAEAMSDGTNRKLYTKPDGRFHLGTLIDAPNPCTNDFGALYANYIKKHEDEAFVPTPEEA